MSVKSEVSKKDAMDVLEEYPKLMNLEDVARALGKSISTIQTGWKDRNIPMFKIGGRLRCLKKNLAQYIADESRAA